MFADDAMQPRRKCQLLASALMKFLLQTPGMFLCQLVSSCECVPPMTI